MPSKSRLRWVAVPMVLAVVCSFSAGQCLAERPPKVSTYAPAEDLATQVDQHLKALRCAVACEEEFKDSTNKIANASNTLIVIALALGLHDETSKYQASAGAIMEAAGQLAAAKDFQSAQAAMTALEEAAEGKRASAVDLQWKPVASLPEVMRQVPLIHTRLKANLKGKKFQSKARTTAGQSAALAAIAQGTLSDTSAARGVEQQRQWRDFSASMRDAAGALNSAIRQGDRAAADEALKKLDQSCDDCHAVFHAEL